MQIVLPEKKLPATIALNGGGGLNDKDYLAFCEANPDLRIERTAEGKIIIVPPASLASSYQSGEAYGQLRDWAKKNKRGAAFDCSAQFLLPRGDALSPDASWVSKERLKQLPASEWVTFPRLCPGFVIEVTSPSDRLSAAKLKMDRWIANGVDLAWLIHGKKKVVYVYRKDQPVEELQGLTEIAGEGPVNGFVLKLRDIWAVL